MTIIDFANECVGYEPNEDLLRAAVRAVLAEAGIARATISLAIVSDEAMHVLNARYLDHDEPTDVLSFVLENDAEHLEGQLIVSLDTARRVAAEMGWSGDDELLLYVIHGTLHLVGYDDLDPESRRIMRMQERQHLARWGVEARFAHEA